MAVKYDVTCKSQSVWFILDGQAVQQGWQPCDNRHGVTSQNILNPQQHRRESIKPKSLILNVPCLRIYSKEAGNSPPSKVRFSKSLWPLSECLGSRHCLSSFDSLRYASHALETQSRSITRFRYHVGNLQHISIICISIAHFSWKCFDQYRSSSGRYLWSRVRYC